MELHSSSLGGAGSAPSSSAGGAGVSSSGFSSAAGGSSGDSAGASPSSGGSALAGAPAPARGELHTGHVSHPFRTAYPQLGQVGNSSSFHSGMSNVCDLVCSFSRSSSVQYSMLVGRPRFLASASSSDSLHTAMPAVGSPRVADSFSSSSSVQTGKLGAAGPAGAVGINPGTPVPPGGRGAAAVISSA